MTPAIPLGVLYYFVAKYCESRHNRVGGIVTVGRCIVALFLYMWTIGDGHARGWFYLGQFLVWWPGLWLPRLVVPLGAPRLAYYLTRFTYPYGFWCEPRGGAAFMAALACAHRRQRPTDAELAFVEEKLAAAAWKAGGATMAGYAVVASLRGDLERARGLFSVVSRLHWRHVAHAVRAHAFEWLAADAVERGTWGAFELPWWRRPRFTWFLQRLRTRMELGPQHVSTASLVALLLVAPHRGAALRLLRTTLQAEGLARSPSAAQPDDVATAAAGWEATLEDRTLRERIGKRLAELGGKSNPDAVLSSLREGVLSELTDRLLREPAELSEGTAALALAARERLVVGYALEIEERIRVVTAMADDRAPDPLLVWGHWASLRRDLLRLRALAPDEDVTLHHLCYPELHDWGVGLVNEAQQGMLAHDIFSFCGALAAGANDIEAKKVCKGHAAACR